LIQIKTIPALLVTRRNIIAVPNMAA